MPKTGLGGQEGLQAPAPLLQGGYLAPEHGCSSLLPRMVWYAIALSSKSFAPTPFPRRGGFGKELLRQDMEMLPCAETAPAWRRPAEDPVTRFPLTQIRF